MSITYNTHRPKLQTFHITLWVLALLAFVELFCVGLALARKSNTDDAVVLVTSSQLPDSPVEPEQVATASGGTTGPRSVEEILASVPDIIPGQVKVSIPQPENTLTPVEEPPEFGAPLIADPKVERFVLDSRTAFVAGDVRKALLKLEEAFAIESREPNVLYHMATSYEAIGQFTKASDFYQRVIELGSDAGGLYPLAARKLTEGFTNQDEMVGSINVGSIQRFRDVREKGKDKIVLTVPVHVAPEKEIDPDKINLKVRIFDRNRRGEIVPALPENTPYTEWATGTADWAQGVEEQLRVIYTLSAADEDSNFEMRKYFGYLVELYYDGDLIDLRARPRMLFSKINPKVFRRGQEEQSPFLQDIFDFPIEDSNPYNPLLPPLPRK